MMYPDYGYAVGFGLLGFLWNVIVFIVVIAIIFWVMRRMRGEEGMRRWRSRWAARSGLSILNERYAKGEIDKAEYEERKKTLLGE